MKVAVLLSGNGSNLQAFIDKKEEGKLDVDICLVISNNTEAYGLKRAEAAGIKTWAKAHQSFPTRETFDQAMLAAIFESGAELIVLAGYMRLLSTNFVKTFEGRIINIHPSLLPSFPGAHAVSDALNYGVKLIGCTVHFVEEVVDSGPVIIQAALSVEAEEEHDDIMQRLHRMEHRIYPQALQWIAKGRISMKGRQVKLSPSEQPKAVANYDNPLERQVLVSPALEQGF